MAALVSVEDMTALAMRSALSSLAAPVTSQVMRCFAPSPSEAIRMASGTQTACSAAVKAA